MSAEDNRDDGLKRVRHANQEWLARALSMLPAMKAAGYLEATGEEMRIFLRGHGCDLPEPTSPNAWGMFVRTAALRGMIADTGRIKKMWTDKSHARRTPVWRLA